VIVFKNPVTPAVLAAVFVLGPLALTAPAAAADAPVTVDWSAPAGWAVMAVDGSAASWSASQPVGMPAGGTVSVDAGSLSFASVDGAAVTGPSVAVPCYPVTGGAGVVSYGGGAGNAQTLVAFYSRAGGGFVSGGAAQVGVSGGVTLAGEDVACPFSLGDGSVVTVTGFQLDGQDVAVAGSGSGSGGGSGGESGGESGGASDVLSTVTGAVSEQMNVPALAGGGAAVGGLVLACVKGWRFVRVFLGGN
jgi:hypothetical protein